MGLQNFDLGLPAVPIRQQFSLEGKGSQQQNEEQNVSNREEGAGNVIEASLGHMSSATLEEFEATREIHHPKVELVDGLLAFPQAMAVSELHDRIQLFKGTALGYLHVLNIVSTNVYLASSAVTTPTPPHSPSAGSIAPPTSPVHLSTPLHSSSKSGLSLRSFGSSNSSARSSASKSSSDGESSLDSAPSSPDAKKRKASSRVPDVSVATYEAFEQMETPEGHKALNRKKKPTLVVEVTSKTTRDTDMYYKWHQYAAVGIQEYLIIDLKARCVTRGYFCQSDKHGDDCEGPMPNGDPSYHRIASEKRSTKDKEKNAKNNNSKLSKKKKQVVPKMYCRRIYYASDVVMATYLSYLKLTAATLLNPPSGSDFLKRRIEKLTAELSFYKDYYVQSHGESADSDEIEEWKKKVQNNLCPSYD